MTPPRKPERRRKAKATRVTVVSLGAEPPVMYGSIRSRLGPNAKPVQRTSTYLVPVREVRTAGGGRSV